MQRYGIWFVLLLVLVSIVGSVFRMLGFDEAAKEHISTVRSKPQRSSCLGIVGKEGSWVQDWDFAEHYGQYPERVRDDFYQAAGFRPTKEAPFPWYTSWKWVDSKGCQIDYTMDAFKVCSLLNDLQVTRVFFYGDSLAEEQFDSFVDKMGASNIANCCSKVELVRIYSFFFMHATLNCSKFDLEDVQIMLERGSGRTAVKRFPRVDIQMSNYSQHFVQTNPQSTLTIMNIGAHYHNTSIYTTDLHLLFQWFDNFQRPKDLVFFRTTPSGHENCLPRLRRSVNWTAGGLHMEPLKNYSEFQPSRKYDWDLFDVYNSHVKQVLKEREKQPSPTMARIRLLDVVNMTLLRHDGHVGGDDCLHYFRPGPVDWWNHLLYTQLQEIAKGQKSRH